MMTRVWNMYLLKSPQTTQDGWGPDADPEQPQRHSLYGDTPNRRYHPLVHPNRLRPLRGRYVLVIQSHKQLSSCDSFSI